MSFTVHIIDWLGRFELISFKTFVSPRTENNTVKLGYNEHAWDRLILFVIAIIRYNREDLCTKVAIWDQKFQL